MSELKSRPPGKPEPQDLDAFILGAEEKTKQPEMTAPVTVKKEKASLKAKPLQKKLYPWEELGIRDDVIKVYNLRLPEAYLMKLKYISDNTPDSMQKFCLQVMQSAIDAKIAELTE